MFACTQPTGFQKNKQKVNLGVGVFVVPQNIHTNCRLVSEPLLMAIMLDAQRKTSITHLYSNGGDNDPDSLGNHAYGAPVMASTTPKAGV